MTYRFTRRTFTPIRFSSRITLAVILIRRIQNCALLGYNAACSGNSLTTFREKKFGLICKGRFGTWISVCWVCCVLSGRGLCDELITRPEESYRMWCVVVCDLENKPREWGGQGPLGGYRAKRERKNWYLLAELDCRFFFEWNNFISWKLRRTDCCEPLTHFYCKQCSVKCDTVGQVHTHSWHRLSIFCQFIHPPSPSFSTSR